MLLADAKMLSDKFTAIHAIHISEQESSLMADAGASICSCPTTERNLGDGILDAHQIMSKGIHICLGSDSQAQIDPLEDARELDYHQRLELEQRAILDQIDGVSIASRLFACATSDGARSLDVNTGSLVPGCFADFFTVDLKETSIAGHSPADLLPMIVFSLGRSAIRDVGVHGRLIVKEKVHELHEEIVARYLQVHERVWSQRS
jgi:formimidoylglutamate deiminase